MIKRAGLPIPVKPEPANLLSNAGRAPTSKELGRDDPAEREARVDERKQWEASRSSISDAAPTASPPRSNNPLDVAADQAALQSELRKPNGGASFVRNDASLANSAAGRAAATRVSEIIAKAGGESAFCGEAMGIGGLDDVLAQVRRRVWVPLAAPPNLLRELGISPVRGLLLYGAPGNGKSLLARKLGQILSPMRPITVVSGPEILDRFVGYVPDVFSVARPMHRAYSQPR
jgi:ATPase family associated with various cellular activities (AAA)